MSVYGDLDEAGLEAEIASLRVQIRAAATSPQAGVRSIAGEGRRVEFFAGGGGGQSTGDLRRLLREAIDRLNFLRGGGSAIGVRFP